MPQNITQKLVMHQLSATTQNDLLKCCYQVITEGLLTELKASKTFALILDEASDISIQEQYLSV